MAVSGRSPCFGTQRVLEWATQQETRRRLRTKCPEPGLYGDEHGLVLRIKPSAYKQCGSSGYSSYGKRREPGLGPVPS